MEITLYGADINIEEEYETVGNIVDTIERKGYIINGIKADGVDVISDEILEELKPIQHLEIFAQKTEDLILESIEEAEEYITKLSSGIEQIIEKFSQGYETEGFEELQQGIEGIDWLNFLLMTMDELIGLEIAAEKDSKSFIERWHGVLNELLGAMEDQDIILISDILEYEFDPLLEEYLLIIKDIADKLNKQV